MTDIHTISKPQTNKRGPKFKFNDEERRLKQSQRMLALYYRKKYKDVDAAKIKQEFKGLTYPF